jgi:hypothetical protein
MIATLSALALAGCATTKAAEPAAKKSAEPVMEKMAVVNNSPFDLAACGPRELSLTGVTDVGLTGVLLAARPMVQECLVNPAHRGSASDTQGKVKTTVSEEGTKHEVTATNLTPEGQACIEKALAKVTLPRLEKGQKAVSAEIPFSHGANSPQVRFGVNYASDLVGTVRLAQSTWCDCYQAVGTTPPPGVKAMLHAAPEKAVEVQVEGQGDGVALASCIEGKLKALTFPAATAEVQVPYTFLLLNSYAATESADAQPNLQFAQLDAIRGQRAADVAVKVGNRTTAALAYDEVVKRYKAKPQPVLIKELKEKCAVLLAGDDAWTASLKSLLEVDQRTQKVVEGLAAKDAAWAPVGQNLVQRVAETNGEFPKVEAQRKGDEAACPKSR